MKPKSDRYSKLKHSAISILRFNRLVRNRRAVSAVISNIILMGAVISVGLVALGYARSTSINYQTQYAESVNENIGKMKETLVFEYAHYDRASNNLYVYFINSGTVNVDIDSVAVGVQKPSFTLHEMNNALLSGNRVTVGQEGYLLTNVDLTDNQQYTIKITSESGTNFVYEILA